VEAFPAFEDEGEEEAEEEGEEFLGALGGIARGLGGLLGEEEGEEEAEEEGEEFLGALGGIARGLGGLLGEEEGEEEAEDEYAGFYESEEEVESEANPLLRAYPDALMEHLGHAASESESEAEAEAFIGALVPLAARLAPKIAPAIMKAAPRMISQAAKVTRVLRQSPTTRPLVRALPNIVRRTTQSLASQAARGRPITPQVAMRTLNRQTLRVLRSPARSGAAIRRARAVDRRYHRIPAAQARTMALPGRGVRRSGPRYGYGPGYRYRGQYRPRRVRYGTPSWGGGGYGAAPVAAPAPPPGFPMPAPAPAPYAYGPQYAPGPYGTVCPCCGTQLG
jgi:hypothetical protein